MAEQLLHGAQVGAAVEQMAGEGVAQHVRADALGVEPGLLGDQLQILREALARQVALRALGGKQPLGGDAARRPDVTAR